MPEAKRKKVTLDYFGYSSISYANTVWPKRAKKKKLIHKTDGGTQHEQRKTANMLLLSL